MQILESGWFLSTGRISVGGGSNILWHWSEIGVTGVCEGLIGYERPSTIDISTYSPSYTRALLESMSRKKGEEGSNCAFGVAKYAVPSLDIPLFSPIGNGVCCSMRWKTKSPASVVLHFTSVSSPETHSTVHNFYFPMIQQNDGSDLPAVMSE